MIFRSHTEVLVFLAAHRYPCWGGSYSALAETRVGWPLYYMGFVPRTLPPPTSTTIGFCTCKEKNCSWLWYKQLPVPIHILATLNTRGPQAISTDTPTHVVDPLGNWETNISNNIYNYSARQLTFVYPTLGDPRSIIDVARVLLSMPLRCDRIVEQTIEAPAAVLRIPISRAV